MTRASHRLLPGKRPQAKARPMKSATGRINAHVQNASFSDSRYGVWSKELSPYFGMLKPFFSKTAEASGVFRKSWNAFVEELAFFSNAMAWRMGL